MDKIEDKIKKRIVKLFQPYLKKIEKQSNCKHQWRDKDGSANFRCKKCGYLAEDSELGRLIFIEKLIQRGMTPDAIKRFKEFIR
jgi:tRNA(Ile2) C34 agmatinyltransferase TiaS